MVNLSACAAYWNYISVNVLRIQIASFIDAHNCRMRVPRDEPPPCLPLFTPRFGLVERGSGWTLHRTPQESWLPRRHVMNTAFRQDFRVVEQGLLDVNRGAMSLLVQVARRPSSHDRIIALQSLASSAAPLLGTMTSLVVVGGR
jgi:hypothetical protein